MDLLFLSFFLSKAWLADLILAHGKDLPKVILGKSFKPETNLTVGSPSILLSNIVREKGSSVEMYDPYVDGEVVPEFCKVPSCFFIGTKHDSFKNFDYPAGSIVLDPHRYIPDKEGVTVIQIGKGQGAKSN